MTISYNENYVNVTKQIFFGGGGGGESFLRERATDLVKIS